ncbi:enamine deaminase RidA (YjgF/YER057c/UK114 family) [Formosa algae]|uniref:Enamine deaminase RidA (YjgF/YER057c/UK114 family) n=2 Tax=Formosa algae TaxID=225843 RepID=A0A9X1CBY8_9FLAO|nr:RidA family protein [Formosa algae]MBP1840527.1 enamine deaminase RidA (YjgF/YER057c/UK114 family) [Formosa algae]MDQ0336060.1 enamine deaminase RidA (YjgF/YER057c/UK114 family) [Formosa algae]
MKTPTLQVSPIILALLLTLCFTSCNQRRNAPPGPPEYGMERPFMTPEYFSLRPEVENAYGYTHAVKLGHDIKISGAVSMDENGNPTAVGDFEQQMKNCYADLDTILKHYGCTFDDVVVENIFTTNMALFLEHAAYRNTIYTTHFPTGSWLGVTELAVPEFMIEIELEVYKPEYSSNDAP